ncbi:hypothetical protein Vadar_025441 [Vaccinium darrowii]|uniref:Uncharacterized protein n=1 Tax=Vaccinium darrowii TaxID=229202 RepID=A0ACB7Y374_9ERIC|nr:hypothetical protein Vadar_025441 [Vaccinium darrowii]
MDTNTTKTLAVEVDALLSFEPAQSHEKNGNEVDENGGNPGEKPKENLCNESRLGENGEKTGEGGRNLEGNHDGNENKEEVEEEGDGDEEHEYFVGDFVWGKIKGYPWWPGQIYDPSDASEYARKYNRSQRERLLVAYFGDRSFSWCHPSQLKPFDEGYEEMSKQTDSKSFLNALQKAVEGIGRLVELKLTCSCVSDDENQFRLAENAGIKQGVVVPECGTRRISIPPHGPARVIATVKYIAEVGSTTSMLDLSVLRSFLSAFYRAKGGHKLAVYQEPLQIQELENKNRDGNEVSDVSDISSPGEEIKGGLVPGDLGFGQTNQRLFQKCHRRKKKSVAKLVKEHEVIEPNGKRKRKHAPPSSRKRGRKEEAELSGSPKYAEDEVLSAKHGSGGGEEEEEEEEETKQDKVSSIENGDKIAEEGNENVCVAESEKIAEPLGERMIRVANQLIGSPPIAKCSGEIFQEKLPNEFDNPRNPHPPHDSMEIDAYIKEVVSEQRSAAQNPIYLGEKNSVDRFVLFISAFRSALFLEGSNYKMYHRKLR